MALEAEEAESLYAAKKHPMLREIQWAAGKGPFSAHTVRIPVECDDGTQLLVIGWWVPMEGTLGFSILFNGQRIRMWDDHGKKQRPRRGGVRGPHKHSYDPADPLGGPAYPVTDITERNPTKALLQFLRECNVQTQGMGHQSQIELERDGST